MNAHCTMYIVHILVFNCFLLQLESLSLDFVACSIVWSSASINYDVLCTFSSLSGPTQFVSINRNGCLKIKKTFTENTIYLFTYPFCQVRNNSSDCISWDKLCSFLKTLNTETHFFLNCDLNKAFLTTGFFCWEHYNVT